MHILQNIAILQLSSNAGCTPGRALELLTGQDLESQESNAAAFVACKTAPKANAVLPIAVV